MQAHVLCTFLKLSIPKEKKVEMVVSVTDEIKPKLSFGHFSRLNFQMVTRLPASPTHGHWAGSDAFKFQVLYEGGRKEE